MLGVYILFIYPVSICFVGISELLWCCYGSVPRNVPAGHALPICQLMGLTFLICRCRIAFLCELFCFI